MKNFMIFLLIFSLAIISFFEIYAQENEYEATLVGSIGTIATPIKVKKGDKIEISAFGTINLGTYAGDSGPDGIKGNFFTDFKQYNISCNGEKLSCRHGKLIARIGDGECIDVGSSHTFYAGNSGYLKFMLNDDKTSDNSGNYYISITITKN